MLFLNSLYRDAAGKAGITYVDVWDGFVDEAGRFLQRGPDFEGQTRQLRSDDGVYFTKPGARKLAHYVEREITRLSRRVPRRSRCRANPPRPTPMHCRVSRRRARWRDRSCRWWLPRSAPINCSAAQARDPPRSMRSQHVRWSRANRWRRRPAAPMILSGPAARSDANWPRARPRWPRWRRKERPPPPSRARRRSQRPKSCCFAPRPRHQRRSETSSALAPHRAKLRRLRRGRPPQHLRDRRASWDDRHRFPARSRGNAIRARA